MLAFRRSADDGYVIVMKRIFVVFFFATFILNRLRKAPTYDQFLWSTAAADVRFTKIIPPRQTRARAWAKRNGLFFFVFFTHTYDGAVFFQRFQHVLVGHGVRHACQRQDRSARARVHQQHRHVTDFERRMQRAFQTFAVGKRHVTSFVRQTYRAQFVPKFGVLYGVDHFVYLQFTFVCSTQVIAAMIYTLICQLYVFRDKKKLPEKKIEYLRVSQLHCDMNVSSHLRFLRFAH